MNKVFKSYSVALILLSLFSVFILNNCGSKRNPTGGKEDIDKPTVLASIPEEYADISDQKIELTFSKPIDRATFLKGLYIYPPVANKKVYFEAYVVTIKFLEALEKDTNYYVTLTNRIKDVRGNAMAQNQTLVYKHGALQKNRISGSISYENPLDSSLDIQLNLLTSDSLWVLTKALKGSSYAIDALNPNNYILRAYIDKNQNGRYDMNAEPYQEHNISSQSIASYDLKMAYADTVKPVIKTIQAVSNREYRISLNKSIESFQKLLIQSVNTKENVPVFAANLDNDRITVLTAQTDTSRILFSMIDAEDNKGNKNSLSSLIIPGSRLADKTPPVVLKTTPRNGSSVNNLLPVLEITFSEIIPQSMFKATLVEVESGRNLPYKVLSGNGFVYRIQPLSKLKNYMTCMLTIDNNTSDISGNSLQKPYKLVILPLFRDEQPNPKQ